ncbi:MAG: glycerophosphodiester phosphodiesterase family protein [Aureispira sp.]
MFTVHGHRGCRAYLPENTLPAFFKAAALGCHALEMDVVITKDKQVLVSHEPWLNAEICLSPSGKTLSPSEGKSYNLYNMTYAQIKQLDCGSLGHPRFPEQQGTRCYKPSLADTITAMDQYCAQHGLLPIHFTIEVKREPEDDGIWHPDAEEFVYLIIAVLEEKGALDRAIVQSFDLECLQVAHRLKPTLRLSYLTDNNRPLAENLALLDFFPGTYGPNFKYITTAMMEEAHHLGLAVIPWTVNEEADIVRLMDWGVAGLISDYPKRVLDVLRKRQQASLSKLDLPDSYF